MDLERDKKEALTGNLALKYRIRCTQAGESGSRDEHQLPRRCDRQGPTWWGAWPDPSHPSHQSPVETLGQMPGQGSITHYPISLAVYLSREGAC